MISKLLAIIRDIALCYVLFLLVQIALKDTTTYISEHKQSLIHELDRDFIDHLYTTQRQLHTLEEHPLCNDTFAATIAELKSKLTSIEEQYKKNSPGLALLGPIGTTAIITKEEQLEKKLLVVINDIGHIVHNLANTQEPFEPATTIHTALKINKQNIKSLVI